MGAVLVCIQERELSRLVNYEISLPQRHLYLSEEWSVGETNEGRKAGKVEDLPIIERSTILALPGQSLPLQLGIPIHLIMRHRELILVRMLREGAIGVIIKMCHRPTTSWSNGVAKFKVIHRVKLLSVYLVNDLQMGSVVFEEEYCDSYSDRLPLTQSMPCNTASMGLPPWVYRQLSIEGLCEQTVSAVTHYTHVDPSLLPSDPVRLSCWLINSLLVVQVTKSALFEMNCVNKRLHTALEILKTERWLECHCSKVKAYSKHLICVSTDGTHCYFINLAQRLANIVTVSECKHIRVSGRYNEDNTWFPSYYWAAISCRRCRQHVGFKYVNHQANPMTFYGLDTSLMVHKETTKTCYEEEIEQSNTR